MLKFSNYFYLNVVFLAVLLFSNCKSKPEEPVVHKIPIKVAIIYNIGGPQPVAREKFHLLNKSATDILKQVGEAKETDSDKKIGGSIAFSRQVKAALDKYSDKSSSDSPDMFEEKLQPNIIQSVVTDLEGSAVFDNVPPGEYYIYGVAPTRKEGAVWNYKVTASSENTTVILDDRNAIYAQ